MRLSDRTGTDRTENRLTQLLRDVRTRREVLDLTESNPTRAGIAYDGSAILAALGDARALAYEPAPLGMPVAREAVARELGVDPARVVITASTSEAYGFLFKMLCDPGDEVLVPRPGYPLFDMLATFEAVRAVPYRLRYYGSWYVELASLSEAVTGRTRAIVSVSPNNPTGSYLARMELAAVAKLGLPIVSDEVFAEYPLEADEERARTALDADAELVFALGGLSKLCGLPQMKLGWIAVGGAVRAVNEALGRLELLGDAFLSVGTPVQVALPSLLAHGQTTRRAIAARIEAGLRVIRERAEGSAVTALRVEGGWYATLRLPNVHDSEAWAALFLEEDGVWIHPGYMFDFESEAYVVASLLTPTDVLAEGISRIVRRADAA